MTREVYLDLDGVCVDHISAALTAHGFEVEPLVEKWQAEHRGEPFPAELLRTDEVAFWEDIDRHGEAFWIDLQPYPWFEELHQELSKLGHVVFCTSSTASTHCISGKLRWLQNRFGRNFRDYIVTSHKSRLAHPNAYLVDDLDHNISEFTMRGGNGVLFPQFWNSNHGVPLDRLEYVIKRVSE